MNIIQDFNVEKLRKGGTVRQFIYDAEINADEMGESESGLLKAFSAETRKDRFVSTELNQIASKIDRGLPKYKAYKDYLDKDLLLMLKDAEKETQTPTSMIFKGFVPYKILGDKTKTKVKKKLYVPLTIFVVAVFGVKSAIESFTPMIEDGITTPPDTLLWILDNYFLINGAYFFLAAYAFIVIPHKVPVIKKIFHRIEGLLVLSTMETLSRMGHTPEKIKKSIIKGFSLKIKKKLYSKDIDALMDLLMQKEYFTIVEAAKVKIYGEKGKFIEGIKKVKETKMEEIEHLGDLVNEIVGQIGLALIALPLGIVVWLFLSILTGIEV